MRSGLRDIGRALRSGETTSTQLTRELLAASRELGAQIGAYVMVDEEGALQAAHRADEALESGDHIGPLTGVPVAVKDIIDMKGLPTRCGSESYPDDQQKSDATLVRKLKASGAVIVGKTTAHELACGVYSSPASNPWDPDRVPGGSSGGSGAAVASGLVAMAVGSDTGGSIRIPASVCGVVGLKPTYGRVSRSGVEPLSWSLDHVGPLADSIEGCVSALEVMAGEDPLDPTTRGLPALGLDGALSEGIEDMRIGVLRGHPVDPMQPDVAQVFETAVGCLTEAGAKMVSVEIPELAHTLATEFGIVGPEAGAYHHQRLRNTPHLVDPDIRALLLAGLLLPAEQYIRSLTARRVISEAIRRVFGEHRIEAIVNPTLPATAVEKNQDVIEYGSITEPVTLSYVRTTAPFNLSGLPAISVPAGSDRKGLPVGLQVAGRPYDERTIVRVARAVEMANLTSGQVPPLHVARKAA